MRFRDSIGAFCAHLLTSIALLAVCITPAMAQYIPPAGAAQDYQQKGNGSLGTEGDPMRVAPASYGAGITAETAASGDVAAATATATLAAAATTTTYLTGFSVTGGGATSASVIACTVTGLITGTLTYDIAVPAGATLGIPVLARSFNPAIPASAVNTTIVVSCPTFGSGNAHASVNAEGFTR